ncbi:MAG: hypothetical protein QOG58_1849, partial [Caballeronia sp.]|nr:hypothetical protein [Caballeronia sp.]
RRERRNNGREEDSVYQEAIPAPVRSRHPATRSIPAYPRSAAPMRPPAAAPWHAAAYSRAPGQAVTHRRPWLSPVQDPTPPADIQTHKHPRPDPYASHPRWSQRAPGSRTRQVLPNCSNQRPPTAPCTTKLPSVDYFSFDLRICLRLSLRSSSARAGPRLPVFCQSAPRRLIYLENGFYLIQWR